ncbi:4-hydroxythreonine-4-phosphate dehydrogenase PdxA [bacterium]|nr:4-hydroxythreonine-4-phosphate dehydrogenase PdxA [bacterium]
MNRKVKIGITIGDPLGIGPEVTLKSLRRFKVPKDCEIFVFGDRVSLIKNGLKRKGILFNLVDLKKIKNSEFRFGLMSKKSGRVSLAYLKEAVDYLKRGRINSLVTAPLSKEAINLNKIRFFGHTEFLASQFGVKDYAMMFVSKKLKLSLVTRHIALKDVPTAIKKENIFATTLLTYNALKNYFAIKKPKIAISGLNPHASEDGLMGREEERIIAPVVTRLRMILKTIYGPIPSDTIFKRALDKEFDAVVCMYHDQGLIPFKMLYFFEGVNLTLGLPFIRTSCVHGTAFDIAGKNKADCRSMLEAIKLAYILTKNRIGH